MRTRHSRLLALPVILVVAALSLSGCSDGQGSGAENTRTTLNYATGDAEPDCLDPHVGGNYPQALLGTNFAESLVSRDKDGKIVPWLAQSWNVSEDGTTWEFHLKDGVKFTDGTPLTWEAVKANVDHLLNPDTASSTGYLAFQQIKDVTRGADDHVAVVHLKQPDSALLESFAQPWNAIESPTALKRPQGENCASPVGTGPFVVDSWTKQDRVVLKRNEDYSSAPADAANQDGPAKLQEIVWRFIPDATTRYNALSSGEVDVIDNTQPNNIVAAVKDSGLEDLNAPRPGSSNRIELNTGHAPFNDKKVREAFIRAANVDDGVNSLFMGTAQRSTSALGSSEPLMREMLNSYPHDLGEANRLLDQAGWTKGSDGIRQKDGKKLTARFPVSTNQSIPAEQSLFEQIQAGAKEVGFDVKLEPVDLQSWYAALGKDEYELVDAPYTKVGPDVLRILYHSDSIKPAPSGYFANHAQIDDKTLDDALDRAQASIDEEERAKLYGKAQQIIADAQVILPLYDQQNHFLHSTEVKGLRALPTVNTPTFLDVEPLPAS